jgi:peptidyl-prolyl cis-trans isomerase C
MVRITLAGLALIFSMSIIAPHGVADEAAIQIAQAKSKKPKAARKIVVAKVVGKTIYKSDVIRAFRALPPQARRQGLERHYPNLLESLVVAKMLTVYGRRLNLQKDKQVKAQLKRAEDALVRDAYIRDLVRKQMTDALLRARYKKWAKKNKGVEEIRARHVLLQTEAKAKEIIKLVKTGQNFAALAKKHSVGRTASRGGDLNFFAREEMVKPFSDAAFALKIGQVTKKPVKSDFGWHVIKLEERRKRSVPTFKKVKPLISQQVGQELSAQIVGELLRQTKVQRYSFDGKQPVAAPVAPPRFPSAPRPKK